MACSEKMFTTVSFETLWNFHSRYSMNIYKLMKSTEMPFIFILIHKKLAKSK